MAPYTASKSRDQGREGWSAIFRHPARLDPATGRTGRRVRRSLKTKSDAEADALISQLDALLADRAYWDAAARSRAAERFDERVVSIFYDDLEARSTDFEAVRESLLPLPDSAAAYRTVLLLGTTGAGKTTLVRQILGTDPKSERFPSTSAAKTTIADAELILTEGSNYSAVVTFVGRDEISEYLTECASEAALAIFRSADEREVRRRLLDHVNQRFRFSYVLGRQQAPAEEDDEIDDAVLSEIEPASIDLEATNLLLGQSVDRLRELVAEHAEGARRALADDGADQRVMEEIIEDNLDSELRGDERFHRVVDSLLDEVQKRFDLLTTGVIRRNHQGWPVSWCLEAEDRFEFLKAVARFSSNYAPLFGTLLTPLVNGIRVAGPFAPLWLDGQQPKLVLIDGEGLGHSPNVRAALPAFVSRRIERVDAVVLVDSAVQPMQAATVEALKAIAASGNVDKLVFCFTHFDLVVGDNLPTVADRQQHVLASAENVFKAIGEEIGPFAERGLRQRLAGAGFFVAGIDNELNAASKSGQRTIKRLTALVEILSRIRERAGAGVSRPTYDRTNLAIGVLAAAQRFQETWRGKLGLETNTAAPKEHWTRVKALSRRFADGTAEEYDTLRPIADLHKELQSQIYLMLQSPLRWEGGVPSDDEKFRVFNDLAAAVTTRLLELSSRRINQDRIGAWREAYQRRGVGSTFERARIIETEVYQRGAPIPSPAASPDQNALINDVVAVVDEVARQHGVTLT